MPFDCGLVPLKPSSRPPPPPPGPLGGASRTGITSSCDDSMVGRRDWASPWLGRPSDAARGLSCDSASQTSSSSRGADSEVGGDGSSAMGSVRWGNPFCGGVKGVPLMSIVLRRQIPCVRVYPTGTSSSITVGKATCTVVPVA